MTASEFAGYFSSAHDVAALIFSAVGLGWFAGLVALAVAAIRPR